MQSVRNRWYDESGDSRDRKSTSARASAAVAARMQGSTTVARARWERGNFIMGIASATLR